MNFFNRAIRNVTRRLSKSVLLLITFFVIGNFVIIGLGVSSASETAKTLTRQKMRAVVTYSIDYDSIWEYTDTITDEDVLNEFYNNYPKITVDEINAGMKAASSPSFGYTEEPLVSSDYVGTSQSSTVDALLTRVMGGNQVKIISWYDNEMGYSTRLAETTKMVASKL